MKKYECTVCGYIYDENTGDQAHGIAPNTAWEDVPPDYECPVCGAPKEMFEQK